MRLLLLVQRGAVRDAHPKNYDGTWAACPEGSGMTRLRELDEQRALLAQAILERAATDPLLIFQPTPKQKPFIESVLYGKKAENWFVAANRSGKSDAGAYIGSSLARFGGDPRSAYSEGGSVEIRDRATSGWVSSIDFPTSRDII